MMYKKSIQLLSLIVMILFMGCDLKLNDNSFNFDGWSEPFIATFDLDGSNVNLITSAHSNSFSNSTPYFVRDLSTNNDEIILLDFGYKIDLLSLDGSYQRTIIDSLGRVECFNQERTKMLLFGSGDIFMVNVDGTELINLTNTPNIIDRDPSFSYNEESVTFVSGNWADGYHIKNVNLNDLSEEILYTLDQNSFSYYFQPLKDPALIDPETIIFGLHLSNETNDEMNVTVCVKWNLTTEEGIALYPNDADIVHSHTKSKIAVNYESDSSFIDTATGERFSLDYLDISKPNFSFSPSDRYLVLNPGVIDLTTNELSLFEESEFFEKDNTAREISTNFNEDRLIGIVEFWHD